MPTKPFDTRRNSDNVNTLLPYFLAIIAVFAFCNSSRVFAGGGEGGHDPMVMDEGGGDCGLYVVCVGTTDIGSSWQDAYNVTNYGYETDFSMEVQDGDGNPITDCDEVDENLSGVPFNAWSWQQGVFDPDDDIAELNGADFDDYWYWVVYPNTAQGLADAGETHFSDDVLYQGEQYFTVDGNDADPTYAVTIYFSDEADREVE